MVKVPSNEVFRQTIAKSSLLKPGGTINLEKVKARKAELEKAGVTSTPYQNLNAQELKERFGING